MGEHVGDPIGFFGLGVDFLGLAKAACVELIERDNIHVVVGDRSVIEQYHELTKWSDFNIAVPVLFNFFHGIELMLKGELAILGVTSKHHRLADLLSQLEDSAGDTEFGRVVAKYVRDVDPSSPLGRFFESNGIKPDAWYEAFKYPESTGGSEFDHWALMYNGPDAIGFWQDIADASDAILEQSVVLEQALRGA
jgi:hypothetical protein